MSSRTNISSPLVSRHRTMHVARIAGASLAVALCLACGHPSPERPVWARTGPGASTCSFGALEVLSVRLPEPLHEAAAVWDGDQVWIFGGLNSAGEFSDRVLRFDPAAGDITVTPHRLPGGVHAAIAVWTGTHVLLFGGRRSHVDLLDEIVRFDPATGSSQLSAARLPTRRYNVGAAAIGDDVYLFGGFDYTHVTDVLRYSPGDDTLTQVGSLPVGTEAPSAMVVGDEVHLLGGASSTEFLDSISRFEPAGGAVTPLASKLAFRAWAPAFLQLGGRGYVYGGVNDSKTTPPVTQVTCYAAATGAVEVSPFELPSPHLGRTTVTVDDAYGLVIGGIDPATGEIKDTLVRFTP